jgi:tetratricopeptide (TPR) repeat protein
LTIVHDAFDSFAIAIVVPLSLFISLLIVRGLSYLWYGTARGRPLPLVVHELHSVGSDGKDVPNDTDSLSTNRSDVLRDLPAMLRAYISADPPLSGQVAPGVASAASPIIPSAAPTNPQAGWAAVLTELVLPQKQAAYEIHLTRLAAASASRVSVSIVRTPQQSMVASAVFNEGRLDELTFQIGGFCIERIQLQPAFLRRTPRWEHWGDRGAYGLFRLALWHQEKHEYLKAHAAYEEASLRALGNIRLAVHRASLYELQKEYDEARKIYDALHCLWKQNIELTFRAATVRVNLVHQLVSLRAKGASPADPLDTEDELKILDEASTLLQEATKDLKFMHVLRRWLRARLPRRRDIGERRYWLSWLRRDTFRQPLVLLRRSRRYEYLNAVKVSRLADEILNHLVKNAKVARSDADKSFKAVTRIIRKKRVGWLAHWLAACYFSRAAQAADLMEPDSKLWVRLGKKSTLSLSLDPQPNSYRDLCEVMAIGEIGRVFRNPCNQLNPELLYNDPDMIPLHDVFKGGMVKVLIGPVSWETPASAGVGLPERSDEDLQKFIDGMRPPIR